MKFNKIFFIILIFGIFLFIPKVFASSIPPDFLELKNTNNNFCQAMAVFNDVNLGIVNGYDGVIDKISLYFERHNYQLTDNLALTLCAYSSSEDALYGDGTCADNSGFQELTTIYNNPIGEQAMGWKELVLDNNFTFNPAYYYSLVASFDDYPCYGVNTSYGDWGRATSGTAFSFMVKWGGISTLAINFPANEQTTADFEAFRLAWNVPNYQEYSDYWGRVNLFFGTDQEKIALCGDELASYYCKDDWPNVYLVWNSWNTITQIKDPIWINKSKLLSQIGTYYARAVFYAISNDVPYEEILLAESPEISFNIIKGNFVSNYWDWVMASTSIPTFVEQASSTFFADISDINSPFYKDCSVYENCDFFSTCTLFAIACDIEKISLKLVWTMIVKYPKVIAESFSDFFNYMVMRFVNTFPLSVLTTFNKAIQDIEATSTPPLILSGTGRIFGGKSFTILSSSTLDWINNTETGFSLRIFLNYVCYSITGLITIGFSVLAIIKLTKPKESETV